MRSIEETCFLRLYLPLKENTLSLKHLTGHLHMFRTLCGADSSAIDGKQTEELFKDLCNLRNDDTANGLSTRQICPDMFVGAYSRNHEEPRVQALVLRTELAGLHLMSFVKWFGGHCRELELEPPVPTRNQVVHVRIDDGFLLYFATTARQMLAAQTLVYTNSMGYMSPFFNDRYMLGLNKLGWFRTKTKISMDEPYQEILRAYGIKPPSARLPGQWTGKEVAQLAMEMLNGGTERETVR